MTTSIKTIELAQFPLHQELVEPAAAQRQITEAAATRASSQKVSAGDENGNRNEALARQKWNDTGNTTRTLATFWSMFIMGANDAAYGPLIPSLQTYYNLTYTIISLVFLSPFVGYIMSAVLNSYIHLRWGQRGIAIIISTCHIVAYIIIACHPPYPVLVLAFILAGFANGIANAAWNTWVGNLANSSEILGILHAMYGAGGVVSPLVSTSMVTKGHLPWYSWYYIMIGLSVVEVVITTCAFWELDGFKYRALYSNDEDQPAGGLSSALFQCPSARIAWTAAAFLLCYAGVEVGLGGWIVEFMISVRQGDKFASGMSAVGFWLGITMGRAILGFVSPQIGIKLSTAIYIAATIALELIFWLVPRFLVSAVAVALQGFFLGPLFPNVVLLANRLLPRRDHVLVIGFASAFSGCGAAVLPFLTGLLAQSTAGVQVLQPIVLSLLTILLLIWLLFPKLQEKQD